MRLTVGINDREDFEVGMHDGDGDTLALGMLDGDTLGPSLAVRCCDISPSTCAWRTHLE